MQRLYRGYLVDTVIFDLINECIRFFLFFFFYCFFSELLLFIDSSLPSKCYYNVVNIMFVIIPIRNNSEHNIHNNPLLRLIIFMPNQVSSSSCFKPAKSRTISVLTSFH